MKRTHDIEANPRKRKKQKISKAADSVPETSNRVTADVLDFQSLREGMLLLGCVTEIRPTFLLMSLPGCIVGKVSLTNISAKYTEVIRNSIADESENDSEVSLDSIIEVGATLPCKVLSVLFKAKMKSSVELSINPQDVNRELKLSSLYLKMVLHVAVQSVEDHGYVMDTGIRGAQGFLPFSASTGQKDLTVGQVIPTLVKKLPSKENGNVVWLSELSFKEPFPEIERGDLNLVSVLPGTNVVAYITVIEDIFFYAKFLDFDACANAMTVGNTNKNLTVGDRVCGTVLCVHPITRMIYLHLGAKPTPNTFKNFFPVKKFALVKNVKFRHSLQRKLFFRFHNTMGFVEQKEVKKNEMSKEFLEQKPVVPLARVMSLHYMDNLVQLSFIKSILELNITRAEDVQVGDIFEVTVKNHTSFGMFVSICLGLNGFVPKIQISDAFVTIPEKLYPVGTKVNCRVLSVQSQTLTLTCKKSLLNLPSESILKSYDEAHVNEMYKGVIVQKTDDYLLVLFFNNVKGLVSLRHIPKSSVFFVGQTITCYVFSCDSIKKKLCLSLKDNKHSTQDISNVKNKGKERLKSEVQKESILEGIESKQLFRAMIISKTAHQLNIVLEGGRNGRIHITELGSTEENVLPLKEFLVGMHLNVHIIGTTSIKCFNFLAVSHRNMKQIVECSLEFPPPILPQKFFIPGMSVNGFVKQVGYDSATLWLSPSQIGTLDYLNVSNNPKILRRLKKEFKYDISLTKLEKEPIRAGCNIAGLVEVATPKKGLIIKLPNGYHGVVCLTDFHDVFSPITNLKKYRKQQFILCHVLEVNHITKFCQLSLRKTRLYNQPKDSIKDYQPELTVKDLEQGKVVKGFIKIVRCNQLIVNIGRMLDGVVSLHKCSVFDCSSCQISEDILQKFSIGDILDVVIEDVTAKENLYSVSLHPHLLNSRPKKLKKKSAPLYVVTEGGAKKVTAKKTQPVHPLSDVKISHPQRLSMTEDIDWSVF
ncbi:protein RRP5 homolog [Trichonephila clavipes]|uniref:Protein RRP5 homolog n=1 Tax=Trichonephila clavipes TaxID=2585209 RepID=A0A8X6UWY2_TRICX|nr:protein RRP5 homolog [Trichonephila clavipes]